MQESYIFHYIQPLRAGNRPFQGKVKGPPLFATTLVNSDPGLSVFLFPDLFARTFPRERLFQPELLTWLQVIGVTLHFLNDVFRLDLPLKAAKSVLNRLALLQSDLCQPYHPQTC
jgi:hypothetical protein